MEKSELLETIGDSIGNRVIDFLIEGKGIDYSKTDIANGCEISRPTLYKILPKLLDDGIAKATRKVGRIELYTLNEQSDRVKALLKLEEVLLQRSFEVNEEPEPQASV